MLAFTDDEIKDASGLSPRHVNREGKDIEATAHIDPIAKTTEKKLQSLVEGTCNRKIAELSYVERRALYEDFVQMLDLTEDDFQEPSTGYTL